MQFVSRKLGELSRELSRGHEGIQTPDWMQNYEELTPYNPNIHPEWLKYRSGTTRNGYTFNMTENEFVEIYKGTFPTYKEPQNVWKPEGTNKLNTYKEVISYFSSKDCRTRVVYLYKELVNYFNQLDLSKPKELNNFKEWKKWWGDSLELILPKMKLINKFYRVYYNRSVFDTLRLVNLAAKIYPLPDFPTRPPMLDLTSRSRKPRFIPYIHSYDTETKSYWDICNEQNERESIINRSKTFLKTIKKKTNKKLESLRDIFRTRPEITHRYRSPLEGGKYKRTKKHKKYKKHKKKNSKNTHHRSKH